MPSTHSQIYLHIVFSTKNRRPYISKAISNDVYGFLYSAIKTFGETPIVVGGWVDHVHLLVKHKPNIVLSDFVRELKSSCSRQINEKFSSIQKFGWQEGYGVFSVSPKGCDGVVRYIQNQESHHSKVTFKEEYETMLQLANVEYDANYLWD